MSDEGVAHTRRVAEAVNRHDIEALLPDLDAEVVLAIGHIRTLGGASGAATESPFALLSDLENGKATRVRTYLDPIDALEAAGLPE